MSNLEQLTLNNLTLGTRSEIDFDKVTSLDDLRDVLRGLQISFWDDGSEKFATVRRFLKPHSEVSQHVHRWIDARNEAVVSGEFCLCGAVRAGNAETNDQEQKGHHE